MAEPKISATPSEARAAILAGHTVRIIVGPDPDDPTCLHYLDRCYEDDFEPMIYSEAIAGWSAGIKECVCEPTSSFYAEWVAEPDSLSIAITDECPPLREAQRPVVLIETADA